MFLPLQEMINKKIVADRIIYISDNQCNIGFNPCLVATHQATPMTLAAQYRLQINKGLWVHSIDLMGYGTQQFVGDKTNAIAGWSEKALEFILLAEQGEAALEKRIAEYEF